MAHARLETWRPDRDIDGTSERQNWHHFSDMTHELVAAKRSTEAERR